MRTVSILSFTWFLLYTNILNAQTKVDPFTGYPYQEMYKDNFQGSPYLLTSWTNAKVSAGGKVYTDIMVNLDIHKGLPLFKINDVIYSFKDHVEEIAFSNNGVTNIYRRGSNVHPSLGNI
ncbi:MAG TPA: hypothetical protein VD794_02365 [Flavisolibacter sp.]|nr:hypothetical protein [Flavisolibacter sp.]